MAKVDAPVDAVIEQRALGTDRRLLLHMATVVRVEGEGLLAPEGVTTVHRLLQITLLLTTNGLQERQQ